MRRVRFSRWLNSLLGGRPDQMISSRVHEEDLYFWCLTIDWWFYVLRRERQHCRASSLWERRTYAQTDQGPTREAETPAGEGQAGPAAMETQTKGDDK